MTTIYITDNTGTGAQPRIVRKDAIGAEPWVPKAELDQVKAENARLRADADAAVAMAVEGSGTAFMDAVWSALKTDANDLRKQQRILQAFLAPASGMAMVEALRKERDDAAMESKTAWALLRVANDNTAGAISERDRLAAAQAQIEALRRALLQIQAGPVLGADMRRWIEWAMNTAALAAMPAKGS